MTQCGDKKQKYIRPTFEKIISSERERNLACPEVIKTENRAVYSSVSNFALRQQLLYRLLNDTLTCFISLKHQMRNYMEVCLLE